jgi:hypothetical protein
VEADVSVFIGAESNVDFDTLLSSFSSSLFLPKLIFDPLIFYSYRWDEWVPPDRLLKISDANLALQKGLHLSVPGAGAVGGSVGGGSGSGAGAASKGKGAAIAGAGAGGVGGVGKEGVGTRRKEGRGVKRGREEVISFFPQLVH